MICTVIIVPYIKHNSHPESKGAVERGSNGTVDWHTRTHWITEIKQHRSQLVLLLATVQVIVPVLETMSPGHSCKSGHARNCMWFGHLKRSED